ncbi:hypothetical protein CVT26_015637 [Gymnopilus dilepis]|uniref:Uncharacterized protein n=1 Tax=Gymnopilus dilepis TaxID=231916 RepID=A0A409YDE3_9AGAR|nr:hypothetical protein CVT26_015637 [Gymnopilus dilepis]
MMADEETQGSSEGVSQDFRTATVQSGNGGVYGRGGDIASYNNNKVQIDSFVIHHVANMQFHSAAGHPLEGNASASTRPNGQTSSPNRLFRSRLVGHNGSDVGNFDDVERVSLRPGAPSITRITKIELQHGRWVHHMIVTYKLSNGETYQTTHGQYMWSPFSVGFCSETIELDGDFPSLTAQEYALIIFILSESEKLEVVAGTASSQMVHEIEFHIRSTASGTVRTAGSQFKCHYSYKIHSRYVPFQDLLVIVKLQPGYQSSTLVEAFTAKGIS